MGAWPYNVVKARIEPVVNGWAESDHPIVDL